MKSLIEERNYNLNEAKSKHDDCREDCSYKDNSIVSGNVKVLFRNLKENLCREIMKSHVVVGSVAWLTEPMILKTLSKKTVSIIVQKEDFLRPDSIKVNLKKLYGNLNCEKINRYYMPNMIGKLSLGSDPSMQPVRCAGIHNSQHQKTSIPRVHNKFVVFCEMKKNIQASQYEAGDEEIEGDPFEYFPPIEIKPYAVWTGSFNFTNNATNSLENAVVIYDENIAKAYFQEYGQIYAISEPLDWTAAWVEPEYRIGT